MIGGVGRTILTDPNGAAAILRLALPGLKKRGKVSHPDPGNELQALSPPRGRHSPPLIPQ
jgi:hypothetical protein